MKQKLFLFVVLLMTPVLMTAKKTSTVEGRLIRAGIAGWRFYAQRYRSIDIQFEKPSLDITSTSEMARMFTNNGVGRDAILSLFGKDTSHMTIDMLYEEALLDVDKRELEETKHDISAEQTEVLKRERSRDLLKNNYIVILRLEKTTKTRHGDKNTFYWYAFHIDVDDEIIDQIFTNWNKPAQLAKIHIPVSFVAKKKVPLYKDYDGERDKYEWVTNDEKATDQFVTALPEFAHTAPLLQTRRFAAALGSKHNLSEGQTIKVYRSKVDSDGSTYSKLVCRGRTKGYVDSDETDFIRISGKPANYKLGDVAAVSRDFLNSINVTAQMSFGKDWRRGIRAEFAHLYGPLSSGLMIYYMPSIDVNVNSGEPENKYYLVSENYTGYTNFQAYTAHINFLGYGLGIPLTNVELVPYVTMGPHLTFFKRDNWEPEGQLYHICYGEEEVNQRIINIGFSIFTGAKAYINLHYPMQLVVGADYNFSWGDRDILIHHQLNRVNAYAGLRFNF